MAPCASKSTQDTEPIGTDAGTVGQASTKWYAPSAPRWTSENRQFVDRAKPAFSPAAETSEFYFVASSVRKSVWTFVRQLRGPHLSTCA